MSTRGLIIAVVSVMAAAELAAAQGAGGIRERRRDGSCVAEGQTPPCMANAPNAKAEPKRDRAVERPRDAAGVRNREGASKGDGQRALGPGRAFGRGMGRGMGRPEGRLFGPPRDGGWGRSYGRGLSEDPWTERWAPRARGFGRGDGWGGGGRGYGMGWRAKAGLCRAGRNAGVGWRAQAGQCCPRCGCGGPGMGCRVGRGYRGGW